MLTLLVLSCQQENYDYLIKGATIIDGTNNPGYIADVGLKGDSIIAIKESLRGRAERVIHAEGKVLAPGFIDLHTHCDWGMDNTITKGNLNYLFQGVTSVVTGNCGYGPGELQNFKTRFEANGIGNNIIPLTGFGWLRKTVMGNEDREPSQSELAQMRDLLSESLDAGSWGLSTGLQYIPEKYSSTQEIIEVAQVMKGSNRIYTTHMRSEEDELVEAVEEAIQIASEAGVPLNIAHLKANGRKNWIAMEQVFDLVERAQQTGIPVTADMYPYDKSATTPLSSVLLYPPSFHLNSIQEIQEALQDPKKRQAIRELTENGIKGRTNWVAKGGWNYFSIVFSEKDPKLINRMFIDLAEERNSTPFDVAADLVIAEGSDIIISLSTMLESNLVKQLQKPWVMLSSDGSAVDPQAKGIHPRNYGSQARLLRKYVREESVLSLAEGIYKMTGLPARTLGLHRKGVLREGFSADLVIFDPALITDHASFLDPHQYASGVSFVWVNGLLAIDEGSFTQQFAGQVLLTITHH